MKKFISIITFLCFTLSVFAQLDGNGYYRVRNMGSNYYIHVEDNTGSINIAKGSADMGAILLWEGMENSVSDPGSVIYFEKHGSAWDFQAQNTGAYKIIGRYLELSSYATTPVSYELGASASGITAFLYDAGKPRSSSKNHILGTTGETAKHRRWYIEPISSNSDNYFGITPKFSSNGKYYAPFYAAFPFSFASEGMKAYIISKVIDNIAVIKPVDNKIIPSKTPLIIECSSQNPSDNRLDLLTGSYSSIASNCLSGVYFAHDDRAKSADARTLYNKSTMRTLAVKDGKLVFNNDETSQHYDNLYSKKYYLNPNEAYLKVSEGTADELQIMTEAEYEATHPQEPTKYSFVINATENGIVNSSSVSEDGKYEEGSSIVLTAVPNEGCSFVKWSDGSTENPYSFKITADASISAEFKVNSYMLSFYVNDALVHEEILPYNSRIPSLTPEKIEGYTFKYWSGTDSETMPAKDLVLRAIYEKNSYLVSYYDGTELVHQDKVLYNDPIPEYSYSKEGLEFVEWEGDKYETMPAKDIKYYAVMQIPEAIISASSNQRVDVYNLMGVCVLKNVNINDLKHSLIPGTYIINKKKVNIK